MPYVTIERVVYSNAAPWDMGADGTGLSLQRVNFAAYGNEPTNWIAATPNAGTSGLLDTDGDGMPDAWEDAHGLNRFVNDANLDPDQDGFTNYQEYLAGTDPHDGSSLLRFEGIVPSAAGNEIRFNAAAGHSYTVLYRDSLVGGAWQRFTDVAAPPVSQMIHLTDSVGTGPVSRYYRLVTPALP